jgi:hypothetical protein
VATSGYAVVKWLRSSRTVTVAFAGIVHDVVPCSTPAGTSPPLVLTTFSSRSGVSSISGMPRGTRNQRDGESRAPRGPPGVIVSAAVHALSSKSGRSQPHG